MCALAEDLSHPPLNWPVILGFPPMSPRGCRFATEAPIARPTRIVGGGDGAFEGERVRGTGTSVFDTFGHSRRVGLAQRSEAVLGDREKQREPVRGLHRFPDFRNAAAQDDQLIGYLLQDFDDAAPLKPGPDPR